MKGWSIKWQVLFLALVPATLIALGLAWFFIQRGLAELDAALHERGLAIARQLAPAAEYGVFSGNREVLRRLAQAAAEEADVKWVAITDRNGEILAAAGEGVRLPPVGTLQAGVNVVVASSPQALDFSAPIWVTQLAVEDEWGQAPPARRLIGHVTVELNRSATQRAKETVLRQGLFITAVGLILAALVALRMGRRVTEPVLRLARTVEKIGLGQLDARVPEDSGGELKVLEAGINSMAAALQASHDNLQQRIADATLRLSYQATHDTLTGLINRREFEARVERALASARSHGQVHTLCYLDLDQFKVVNDTCGHVAGDELLRQLSTLLQSRLRERDTLARLGGDEFGVLLENCDAASAQPIAELLRQTVKDFRFFWQERAFGIGVSIGMVEINADSGNLASLLSAADAACYAAKDLGRNRVHVYQEQDGEVERRRGEMQWAVRIGQAMEENRFRLYRQPILPLAEGSPWPAHQEILLRLLLDDGQPVLPMAFIPAAERYNLMPAIDRWVISKVCSLFHECFGDDPNGPILTVNLSGHSLCDDNFLGFVERQFDLNGVPHGRICFEITESAAITNLREAIHFIEAMKSKGCTFSLDDFGSGLSSFNYLKNLPVDYLKIDGAFVRDMDTDPMDEAMVEAIHRIGRVVGLRTIAECVESAAILERLKRIGVDYVQGDWLAAPVPLTDRGGGRGLSG
jgi:diguanylate cyclase (GGDEF)-like protein